MKKWILKSAVFAILAWVIHYLVIIATPYAILIFIKWKSGVAYNMPINTDIVTDEERRVVMPNPDFLYTAVAYDLSRGPLRIAGKLPKNGYFSIACYAMNTRNYFIKNDRESVKKEYEFILATANQQKTLTGFTGEVVESPGEYGAILVRILVSEKSQVPHLKQIQRSMKISVVRPAPEGI